MDKPTVFAVMKCVVEIPVQPSNSGETFAQMHDAAKREAELALHKTLEGRAIRIAGPVEFSHAIIKVRP